MNARELLDRLAQHLDQTSRAMLPELTPEGVRESVAAALDCLADACDQLATANVPPTDPWIGVTMTDRLDPPNTTDLA